jgi:UDP-GlcNAc:undecaprenyl-phosphate GlcNAc-1-phosphate transferase
MTMIYLSNVLIAFSITANILFAFPILARRFGLIDVPDQRKQHQDEIPLIGGIAMFCGFVLAALLIDPLPSGIRNLLAGAIILIAIGILDDLREMSHRVRFVAEIFAALLVSMGGGTILHDLGAIGWSTGSMSLGILAVPLTVFAMVGVINALNMSDGIDGLAGGQVLVTLSALALITWEKGLEQQLGLLLLLIAVVIAFLSFNLRFPGRPHALVFMGDAGSTFLGFILAWFMINLSQGEQRAMTPVTALWIFALPLVDTVSIMLRRMLNGLSPFQADREHLHHFLSKVGFTVSETLLIILGLATGLAVLGLIGLYLKISEAIMFLGFLGLFLCYLIGMMIAWRDFQKIPLLGNLPKNGSFWLRFLPSASSAETLTGIIPTQVSLLQQKMNENICRNYIPTQATS